MAYIPRYIEEAVRKDLGRKMVFVSGPRQCGKTTLAKRLLEETGCGADRWYLNWDVDEDRERILRREFPAGEGLLVLDEIHKYSEWRRLLKGLFDKRGNAVRILVTGSARLDQWRRGGESLQGRYHLHRLLPFSLREVEAVCGGPQEALERLLRYGGFPEPFLLADDREARRWSREFRSRLVREDLRDLTRVSDLGRIERLFLRLTGSVGSPLSVNALREDLDVAHATVSRWLDILESLYAIFRIRPFGPPLLRAVKKAAKHYHLDWTVVEDPAARFENLVAFHLWKWVLYQQDIEGREPELRYFRDDSGREVDFVVTESDRPLLLVECKTGRRHDIPAALRHLKRRFPSAEALLLVDEPGVDHETADGVRVRSAAAFLRTLV